MKYNVFYYIRILQCVYVSECQFVTSILLASRRLPMWAKSSIYIFHSTLRWHPYRPSMLEHPITHQQNSGQRLWLGHPCASLKYMLNPHVPVEFKLWGFNSLLMHSHTCSSNPSNFLSLPISRPPMDRLKSSVHYLVLYICHISLQEFKGSLYEK